MKKLLLLKHWQLFLVLYGPILILNAVIMLLMILHPEFFGISFPILMMFVGILFFGWLFILGSHLIQSLPAHLAMSLGRFRFFTFVPAAFIILLSFFLSYLTFSAPGVNGQVEPDQGFKLSAAFAIILPLHLFSMFCIFYVLYMIAKALKTIELQRKTSFSDFAGEFFLLWFHPVGVWILQPRINKIFYKRPLSDPGSVF